MRVWVSLEGVGPWILAVVVQVEVRTTLAAVLLLVVEKGWVRTLFEVSYYHFSLEVEKLIAVQPQSQSEAL